MLQYLHMEPPDAERHTPSRRLSATSKVDMVLTWSSGTAQQPGIIFLTMQELFERIADLHEEKVVEVSLSYLEIYNETIRDLLVAVPSANKQGLMLREDSNQAVSVAGLSSHHPRNVSCFDFLISEFTNTVPGSRSHGYDCTRQRTKNNFAYRC
jgi:hypothetical protein